MKNYNYDLEMKYLEERSSNTRVIRLYHGIMVLFNYIVMI